jgi:hypothetical protein
VQGLVGLAIDDISIVHLVTFAHFTHYKHHHALISLKPSSFTCATVLVHNPAS